MTEDTVEAFREVFFNIVNRDYDRNFWSGAGFLHLKPIISHIVYNEVMGRTGLKVTKKFSAELLEKPVRVDLNVAVEMEGVKVSVLMPICNVEQYLDECLKSVTKQTLAEIEIICINDGSTDGSQRIIERFAARDRRIVVINKENSGYGDSMNLGLEVATGDYIAIVEPDDFVEPTMLAEMYYLAVEQKADVVRANYYRFSETEETIFEQVLPSEVAGKLNQAPSGFHYLRQPAAIWSGLYRAEFLKKQKINFLPTPGASYQDTSFAWKTLAAAKKIAFTDKAYYHYRTDNANSSVKNLAKVDMVRGEYREIEKYLREHYLFEKYGKLMQATKFAVYHWNLLRLDRQLLDEFLPKMQDEFKVAWADGLLEKEYFSKKHWWALKLLLNTPKLFRREILFYRWLKR